MKQIYRYFTQNPITILKRRKLFKILANTNDVKINVLQLIVHLEIARFLFALMRFARLAKCLPGRGHPAQRIALTYLKSAFFMILF